MKYWASHESIAVVEAYPKVMFTGGDGELISVEHIVFWQNGAKALAGIGIS